MENLIVNKEEHPFELIHKFQFLHKLAGFNEHCCIAYNKEITKEIMNSPEFLEKYAKEKQKDNE